MPVKQAPLKAALHSTTRTADCEALNAQAMSEDAKGCRHTILISAYYSPSVLRELVGDRTAWILLNGLKGRRLDQQRRDLDNLRKDIVDDGGKVEVRLAFSQGVFHPKLFLFQNRRSGKWIAWIGSANATSAALGAQPSNEEVLLRLYPAPRYLVDYAKAAWKNGSPIGREVVVDSLAAFFQAGTLYYKPYTSLPLAINPFRQLWDRLSPDDKNRLTVFNHRMADPANSAIGAFNVRRVYEVHENLSSIEEERTGRAAIRPYSVETCYGLWVSPNLVEKVDQRLRETAARRDEFYRGLCSWLKGKGRTETIGSYRDYTAAVRQTMDENDVNWGGVLAASSLTDPFEDIGPIERRVDVIVADLSQDERRGRMCASFVRTPVPNFIEDVEAAQEFQRTFFEDLENESFRARRSSAAKDILDAVDVGAEVRSDDIREGLERKLSGTDWYRDYYLSPRRRRR